MNRKDFATLVVAFILLIGYFVATGVFAGAGLQLIGVEVLIQRFLAAWVYWNISALLTIGLFAALWKVINEPT